MYYPCLNCPIKGDEQYTKECDKICDYAKAVKEKNLLEEAFKMLRGNLI